MNGETNLQSLISKMVPQLQQGEYVFCTVKDVADIDINKKLLPNNPGY